MNAVCVKIVRVTHFILIAIVATALNALSVKKLGKQYMIFSFAQGIEKGQWNMSVLIKDMEMPTSCGECDLCVCYVREDGTKENYRCPITLYVIHNFDERHKHCPLIEVPPHGDLIDRRELNKQIDKMECYSYDPFVTYMSECINDAKAIIEAEGEQ